MNAISIWAHEAHDWEEDILDGIRRDWRGGCALAEM